MRSRTEPLQLEGLKDNQLAYVMQSAQAYGKGRIQPFYRLGRVADESVLALVRETKRFAEVNSWRAC